MNITNIDRRAFFLINILVFSVLSSTLVFSASPNDNGVSFSEDNFNYTNNFLKPSITATESNLDSPPQILRVLGAFGFEENLFIHFDTLFAYPFSAGPYICDTLVDYDFETGELIPSLARSWVVTNDSLHWIFYLRDDVWFHDGSKFTAAAVKFNYERMFDPNHPAYVDTPHPYSGALPLESVDILNDYTVVFTFSKPYSSFSKVHAATFDILSPDSFQGANLSLPIGTGPYKFAEFVHDPDKLVAVLTRNLDYFRGPPPFEAVHYVFHPYEYKSWIEALINREGDITTRGADLVQEDTAYWNLSSSGVGTMRLGWFNHNREEFADYRVRQALNYAVNKTFISSHFSWGSYGTFWNPQVPESIFPRFLPFRDDTLPGYPYNVVKANQLLEEAGYSRNTNGHRFNLEITSPYYFDEMVFVAEFFDDVGINYSVVVNSWGKEGENDTSFMEQFLAGDYDMVILPLTDIYDPNFLSFLLHSNGSENTGGYSNPMVDKLLDLIHSSPAEQEREYYFKLVQVIAQTDAPYLLLPESNFYRPIANHVKDFVRIMKTGRPSFNYHLTYDSDLVSFRQIPIDGKAVFFPNADVLIAQVDSQPFFVNLSMSHSIEALLPAFKGSGKFYKLESPQTVDLIRFRCYYDDSEVTDLSLDQFYILNPNSESWIPVEIVDSNTSLKYVEIVLPGGAPYLSLGRKLFLLTFRLVPIISIVFGSVLLFAVIVLFYNQMRLSQLKRRYKLQ